MRKVFNLTDGKEEVKLPDIVKPLNGFALDKWIRAQKGKAIPLEVAERDGKEYLVADSPEMTEQDWTDIKAQAQTLKTGGQ